MTVPLFASDAYLSTCDARVTTITENNGIILDQTVFYATSGGQSGDSGFLEWEDGSKTEIEVASYEPGNKTRIIHVPVEDAQLPEAGAKLVAHIDWERRYDLMRMHTACHLLSVVCPMPITGAAVSVSDSRIDFDMTETADKGELTDKIQALVEANHPVYTRWIEEAELDANPGLVKSKNVKPPRGIGKIRLVCIGDEAAIDSQPCGGTHVGETREIGEIHIGKIEKKGRENRRMRLRFGPLPQT